MTQYTASVAQNMDQLNILGLFDGVSSARTSTSFQIDEGAGYIEYFTGTNLTYDSNYNLTGGTLTGWTEKLSGNTVFTMTGMSVDGASFSQWAHDGNNAAAINAIFGGDDSITGSQYNDVLDGFGGHDYILGGNGADTIIGADGNDHLYGQSSTGGLDGADSITGGNGSDYLQGNAGNDTLDGGTGSDRINGGADDDLISGGIGADTVNGNRGNDTIDGGDGNDFLRGGRDNDSVSGGTGDDQLLGDLGNDTVTGGTGFDLLTGGDGSDLFKFASGDAHVSAATNYASDVILDYVDGTDTLALGFTVAAVLTGTTQASVSAAASYAQQLLDNHAGNGEVAAIHVGSDTYLFFGGDGGATADSAIKVAGVDPSVFTTSDFV